jgi:hypothetical protein
MAALVRLQQRIETIAGTFTDQEIHERLAPLRGHLSTAATMLAEPTHADLKRAAERVDYATKQLALFTMVPEAARRGPCKRGD